MSSSVFTTLLSTYTSWPGLKSFLSSEAGGSLRIYDESVTPEYPYALIRYVKGLSNFAMPHVGAFRSVVWDTLTNRPVSVTPYKSVEGESLPETGSPSDYRIEQFIDGVLIGTFYDTYNERWQLHTRSTLNANCRYYSQSLTFRDMFYETMRTFNYATLDKSCSYSYVLRHSENRVVCAVPVNASICVQINHIDASGLVTDITPENDRLRIPDLSSWDAVKTCVCDWDVRFRHNAQGLVVKNVETGQRWKLRTPSYNAVRKTRGNSARRDYIWLSAWRKNALSNYLGIFPEEKQSAEATVASWKRVTNDVFHIYTDVFKARTLAKSDIAPKYRPLVYGLHSKFMEELKPIGKSIDWRTTLQYMNDRDTAQMLFVINWEKRQAARQLGVPSIPIEPSANTLGEGEIILPTTLAELAAFAQFAAVSQSPPGSESTHYIGASIENGLISEPVELDSVASLDSLAGLASHADASSTDVESAHDM